VAVTNVEQEILARGLNAPRVTLRDIENAIVSEHYFTAGEAARDGPDAVNEGTRVSLDFPSSLDRLTICVLVLQNGYTVTGESACVSAENFDPEFGRKVARQHAVSKIWPLLGFKLASDLAKPSPISFETNPNY